jgi:hypothetical protein
MFNNLRAKSFEAVTNGLKLADTCFLTGSTAVAATAPGEQIADERPDADADGDGLIGMLMHGLVGRLGTFDRLLADAPVDFLAAFQGGGQPLAGVADFFPGHIGGGGWFFTRRGR